MPRWHGLAGDQEHAAVGPDGVLYVWVTGEE
jgi:hypothetical protein